MVGPEQPDDARINLVLDLALRIGETQLAGGAGAADVIATVFTVARAYGITECEADVTYTSIMVSCQRGPESAPVSALRVVRSRGMDYSRLEAAEQLVRAVSNGAITAEKAHRTVMKITASGHPYPRWVATLAWALMAAAIAVFINAQLSIVVVSALVSGLIDRVGRLLNRRGLPFFFQQVAGGALAGGAAMGLYASGAISPGQSSRAVSAAIVVLLSGLSLVGAAKDAITGFNVTAAGRATEIMLMTTGLIVGVLAAVRVAIACGVRVQGVSEPLSLAGVPIAVAALAGGAAAAFFALAGYATRRTVLVSGAGGVVGAVVSAVLAGLGVGPIPVAACAATVIGFGGGLVSRRLRLPPLVVAISGITPLLPGLAIYRGLFELVQRDVFDGVATLMTAAGIGVALAAGVVLGEWLAHPVRRRISRLEMPVVQVRRGTSRRRASRGATRLRRSRQGNDPPTGG